MNSAELIVEGPSIPLNGTEGTFGYGLRADGKDDTIMVVDTPSGLVDSEDQRFIEDGTWHTHLVKLGDVEQCEDDKGIVDITWQSPGEASIDDDTMRISGVPTDDFNGWDSITGNPLPITLGEDINEAISFKLNPVFGGEDDDELEAICLTDIRSAEEVILD